MPITKETTERTFHHNLNKNHDGTCERWRRNGQTKTWKTRPSEFSIPVKHGMRDYGYITNFNSYNFHLANECPS